MYKRLIHASSCVVIHPITDYKSKHHILLHWNAYYDTLLWIKSHYEELGIREDRLMVVGESVGDRITAVILWKLIT